MVIQRKGRATKWDKIQNAIKNAKNIQDCYIILEQFRLTSAEERQIAQTWQREQEMLFIHQKGVYVQEVTA